MNPWKILGVHRQMPLEDVHDRYIDLARKHHPDTGGCKDKFSVISGAYALLKDKDALKGFIAQLNAIGKPCEACKGAGAVYKQKGLTARTAMACDACEGSGIILKKEKLK